jgi:hypothetical protein
VIPRRYQQLQRLFLKDDHIQINNDGVYVIVTTKEHPLCEIFGSEFVPIDIFFPDMSDFNWS